MKVEQYIGQLEEELVKYQYTLDVFDKMYLVDKLFMLTETINREHVNRMGYVSSIHSTFMIGASESSLERLSPISDTVPLINYELSIPALLTALNDNVVREVVVREANETYYLNYIIPEEFDTKEDNPWTAITKSFGVVDDTTLVIGRFRNSLMNPSVISNQNDIITVRGIFKDQRDLLPADHTANDVMNIDLKVASTYRLMILFKKDVFTTIGIAQDDGNRDDKELEDSES